MPEEPAEALVKQIDISVNTGDDATDNLMNSIIEALNHFQMDLADCAANKPVTLRFTYAIIKQIIHPLPLL